MAAVLGGLRTGSGLDGVDVMGMSPSCHCICPGAGGGLSPGSPIETVAGCETNCTSAAARYTVTITNATCTFSSCACCDFYRGTYILHHAGGCVWESTEQDKNWYSGFPGSMTCLDPTSPDPVSPRFRLEKISTTAWEFQIRYRLWCSGFPASITERRRIKYTLTTSSKDCMTGGTMTWSDDAKYAGSTCGAYSSLTFNPCTTGALGSYKPGVVLAVGP